MQSQNFGKVKSSLPEAWFYWFFQKRSVQWLYESKSNFQGRKSKQDHKDDSKYKCITKVAYSLMEKFK